MIIGATCGKKKSNGLAVVIYSWGGRECIVLYKVPSRAVLDHVDYLMGRLSPRNHGTIVTLPPATAGGFAASYLLNGPECAS